MSNWTTRVVHSDGFSDYFVHRNGKFVFKVNPYGTEQVEEFNALVAAANRRVPSRGELIYTMACAVGDYLNRYGLYEKMPDWVRDTKPLSGMQNICEPVADAVIRLFTEEREAPGVASSEALSEERCVSMGTVGCGKTHAHSRCSPPAEFEPIHSGMRREEVVPPAASESAEKPRMCPTCESPNPSRHPALQYEGDVHLCEDPWHSPTATEIRAKEQPQGPTLTEREEGRVRMLAAHAHNQAGNLSDQIINAIEETVRKYRREQSALARGERA